MGIRGRISPVFQSTDRSWHDLDFCLKAIFLFFRATIRPRKRLAFLLMLSRRLQLAMRRAFSSLLSLRRRICRTMPSKRSRTLWCREAEVSMNLQSNTTAQALPSREMRKKTCRWAITPLPERRRLQCNHYYMPPGCSWKLRSSGDYFIQNIYNIRLCAIYVPYLK